MDCVISELCYKGIILQRNYRKLPFYKGVIEKLPFYGHFPIIPLQNSMAKRLGATT